MDEKGIRQPSGPPEPHEPNSVNRRGSLTHLGVSRIAISLDGPSAEVHD